MGAGVCEGGDLRFVGMHMCVLCHHFKACGQVPLRGVVIVPG